MRLLSLCHVISDYIGDFYCFYRNQSSDFHVKKLEHGYLVRKHPAQTSLRPKSAVISSRFKPPPKPADSDSFEDDEEFYTHASTEVSPVATPRTVWSESDKLQADTSTQTSITTGLCFYVVCDFCPDDFRD